ncbi:hypothetical protein KZP23_08525 [Echinicola marina]|uniref:hypothetical protein n=1 Tax=Echinicola marina TaxID=2859768 RepID=UPI001CF7029C|nr:hypothetical protein [Echinicola marina]UCS95039.1 hypothetical protein KZP23_08525 [Echinicola marina]
MEQKTNHFSAFDPWVEKVKSNEQKSAVFAPYQSGVTNFDLGFRRKPKNPI